MGMDEQGRGPLDGRTGPPDAPTAYWVDDRTSFLPGGLGVVYRARLTTPRNGCPPGTIVAVKSFNNDVSAERFEKLSERFPALLALEHPNLARLVEVFVGPPFSNSPQPASEATERYCVHEWIEGSSLAERCHTASPAQLIRWIEEIASALDYLHSHPNGPFAHRDIHPRNIVISDDGHAVLIDFDTIYVESVSGTLTAVLLEGTRFAPQERGEGVGGAQQDDRWSLARTLLYCLADEPSGQARMQDVCSQARARLKGFAADPAGIVSELQSVVRGRDPKTAGRLLERVERRVRHRVHLPRSTRVKIRSVGVVAIAAALAVSGAVLLSRTNAGAPQKKAIYSSFLTGLTTPWTVERTWLLNGTTVTESDTVRNASDSGQTVEVQDAIPTKMLTAGTSASSTSGQVIDGGDAIDFKVPVPARSSRPPYQAGTTDFQYSVTLKDLGPTPQRTLLAYRIKQAAELDRLGGSRVKPFQFLSPTKVITNLALAPDVLPRLSPGGRRSLSAEIVTSRHGVVLSRALANARWSTSNSQVATVPSGPAATVTVSYVGSGTAKISASVGTQTWYLWVTVSRRAVPPNTTSKTTPPTTGTSTPTATTTTTTIQPSPQTDVSPYAGTAWMDRYHPAGNDSLGDISCPTTKLCVMVGDESASTTDGGRTWRRFPLLPKIGQLSSLTCPTPSFCLAAGGVGGPTDDEWPFWSSTNQGRTWHVVDWANQGMGALDLSCANQTLCLDTWEGQAFSESTTGGRTWSSPTLPIPSSDSTTSTDSVSCASSSDCFVAGTAYDPSSATSSLMVWKLVRGSFTRVLNIAGYFDGASISCTSSGTCALVGTDGGTSSLYYATTDAGARWTYATLPAAVDVVAGLSCAAQTCSILSEDGNIGPLEAFTSHGAVAGWQESTIAPLVSFNYNAPTIACPSSTACFVSGFARDGSVAVRGGSGHWVTSRPASGVDALHSVSCSAPLCIAVGGSDIVRSTDTGIRWAPSSKGISVGSNLSAVVCPSTAVCMAVGAFGGSGALYRSNDSGLTWRPVATLGDDLFRTGPLVGVACWTPEDCVAGGARSGLLFSRNAGVTWTLRTYPRAWNSPRIIGLSCALGGCLAIGAAGREAVDISVSRGSAMWRLHPITTIIDPASVSCESASRCWAVGATSENGPPGQIPAGAYMTNNGGASWTLTGPLNTGNPGIASCAKTVCVDASAIGDFTPAIDELATSRNGGITWVEEQPPISEAQVFAVTSASGHWIAVGENTLGGPEIITSP